MVSAELPRIQAPSVSTTFPDSPIPVIPRGGLLARAWTCIANSLNPETEAEAVIVADQIRVSRGTTEVVDLAMPIAAALIAFSCRHWVPSSTLLLWAGGIVLICAGLMIVGHRIDPQLNEGVASVRRVARIRTAMTTLFMAAWCTMGIFLWVPDNPINHILLILFLACSMAGSASILAAHPASAAATLIMHGSMLTVRPLLAGDPMDLTLSGLSLLFTLIMIGLVRTVYLTGQRARDLEFERRDMMRDLTRAKAEADRDRAIAVEAGQAKSEFLSHMNHELRTPMNAILGFSELIKSKAFGDETDRYAEYGEIIHDSGEHLLMLINDMLDLAKIEGGRLTLQEDEFRIGELIREVTEAEQAKADAAQLTLITEIARGLPTVTADRRALRQIVANLLSNAIKFTPPEGEVTVSATLSNEGRLAISVQDNGIGIAPEDRLQVFERFGRGRHDVSIADKGTGLGLAIVKGFAEAHDGAVALESEPGIGTRVTVYLPAERLGSVAPVDRKAG